MDEKALLEEFKEEYSYKWEFFDYHDKGEGDVEQLQKVLEEGMDVINETLYEYNLDYIWEVSDATIKEFCKDKGIDEDDISLETREEMRLHIEDNMDFNVEILFDYNVLLIDARHVTPVSYSWSEDDEGVQDEFIIPEDIEEYQKWKTEALKYIGEDAFRDVIQNSTYGGNAFIGILINGSELIEAFSKGIDVVSGDPIVGIEDGVNGSGYYVEGNGQHQVLLEKAYLSIGDYSIGAVFGTNDWKY